MHPTADLWGPFKGAPKRAGIFADFDGTLAPIVDDPDLAAPLPELPSLLDRLAESYATVGVLTGRPVDFLDDHLSPRVLLVGLYGLEVIEGGVRNDHPNGGVWREAASDVAAQAVGKGIEGMRVEAKGLSVTLHYRQAPDLADEVLAVAQQLAARSGMVCRPAKMSYELHPPIAVDKGTALLDLARELDAVCFVGDDTGDLPAFDALDKLAGDGAHTVRVAVGGAEASDELCARADVCVDGPAGVAELLADLVVS